MRRLSHNFHDSGGVWLPYGAETDLGFVAQCATRVKRVVAPERAALRFLSVKINGQSVEGGPLITAGEDDWMIALAPGQAFTVRVRCEAYGARHWRLRWSWRRPFKIPEPATFCAVGFFVVEASGAP